MCLPESMVYYKQSYNTLEDADYNIGEYNIYKLPDLNDFCRDLNYYNQNLIDDEKFHVSGYPESISVEFAYDMKEGTTSKTHSINSLFPTFDSSQESGMDYLFMPLHFRQYTIGYFVIRKAVFIQSTQCPDLCHAEPVREGKA